MKQLVDGPREDPISTRVCTLMFRATGALVLLTAIMLFAGSKCRTVGSDRLHLHLILVHDLLVLCLMRLLIGAAPKGGRWRTRFDLSSLPAAIDAHPRVVCLVAMAVVGIMHFVAYQDWPLSIDEYCYVAQAKLFASGHVAGYVPPEIVERTWWPYFVGSFIRVTETGEAVIAYWPGYSALMAPFARLGAPWVLNMLLAGGCVLAIRRICHAISPAGSTMAGWAVLFTISSPVFFANAISFYYHVATLFLNLCFVLLLMKPTLRRLLAAGLLGGWACQLGNPASHFCFAVPWIVATLFGERGLRKAVVLVMAYVPSIIFFIAWHAYVLSFDQTHGREAFTFVSFLANFFSSSGVTLIFRTLAIAKMWSWATPGLLLLALLGWLRFRKENRVYNLLGWSCVFTFAFYLFIGFSQGHGWGYRYMFGAWGAFPILAAAAMGRFEETKRRHLTSVVAFLALTSIAILLPLRFLQIGGFVSQHLAQRPDRISETEDPQVVFIDKNGVCTSDLVQNDLLLRNSPLYLVSKSPDEDREFMAAHFPHFHPIDPPTGAVWKYQDVDARDLSPTESYWFRQLDYRAPLIPAD